jgi:hypothetical protein
MKQVRGKDIMEQIIAMLAEERAKEKELLERGQTKGSVSSGCGLRMTRCPLRLTA